MNPYKSLRESLISLDQSTTQLNDLIEIQREARQGATEKLLRISQPIEFPKVRLTDDYNQTITDAGVYREYEDVRSMKEGTESLQSSVYNSLLQSSAQRSAQLRQTNDRLAKLERMYAELQLLEQKATKAREI